MQFYLWLSGSPWPLCPSTPYFLDSVRPKPTHCVALGDSHKLSVLIWGTGRSFLLGERFRDNNAYPDARQVGSGAIAGVGVCGYVV